MCYKNYGGPKQHSPLGVVVKRFGEEGGGLGREQPVDEALGHLLDEHPLAPLFDGQSQLQPGPGLVVVFEDGKGESKTLHIERILLLRSLKIFTSRKSFK